MKKLIVKINKFVKDHLINLINIPVFCGLVIRSIFIDSEIIRQIWCALLIFYLLYIIWLCRKIIDNDDPFGNKDQKVCILGEVLFFSLFYACTGNSRSDIYLLFFIPLIRIITRLKNSRKIYIIGTLTIYCISTVLLYLLIPQDRSILMTFLLDIIPRITMFTIIIVTINNLFLGINEKRIEIEKFQRAISNSKSGLGIQKRLSSLLKLINQFCFVDTSFVFLLDSKKELTKLVAIYGEDFDLNCLGNIYNINDTLINGYSTEQGTFVSNLPEFLNIKHGNSQGYFRLFPIQKNKYIEGFLCLFSKNDFLVADTDFISRVLNQISLSIRNYQLINSMKFQKNALEEIIHSNFISGKGESEIIRKCSELCWRLSNEYLLVDPNFVCSCIITPNNAIKLLGTIPKDKFQNINNFIKTIDIKSGIVSRAINNKRIVVVDDVKSDSDYLNLDSKTKSQIVLPFINNSATLGFINIEFPLSFSFPVEYIQILEIVAQEANIAIQYRILVDKISHDRDKIRNLITSMLKIDFRDNINILYKKISETFNNVFCIYRMDFLYYKINETSEEIEWLTDIGQDLELKKYIEEHFLSIIKENRINDDTFDVKKREGIVYSNKFILNDPQTKLYMFITYKEQMDEEEFGIAELISLFIQNSILVCLWKEREENKKQELEALLDEVEKFQNFTRLGLAYGETLHWSNDQLSIAKAFVEDIQKKRYKDKNELDFLLTRIYSNIDNFQKKLYTYVNEYMGKLEIKRMTIEKIIKESLRSKKIWRVSSIQKKEVYRSTQVLTTIPDQLKQVFYVLFENAYDAMASGIGELKIETDDILINSQSYVRVIISDTGKGINPKIKDHIFKNKLGEKQNKSKGSGLGLLWAGLFINGIGGKIFFEDNLPKGTKFFVIIPVKPKLNSLLEYEEGFDEET